MEGKNRIKTLSLKVLYVYRNIAKYADEGLGRFHLRFGSRFLSGWSRALSLAVLPHPLNIDKLLAATMNEQFQSPPHTWPSPGKIFVINIYTPYGPW
jgi:hypothetical protein